MWKNWTFVVIIVSMNGIGFRNYETLLPNLIFFPMFRVQTVKGQWTKGWLSNKKMTFNSMKRNSLWKDNSRLLSAIGSTKNPTKKADIRICYKSDWRGLVVNFRKYRFFLSGSRYRTLWPPYRVHRTVVSKGTCEQKLECFLSQVKTFGWDMGLTGMRIGIKIDKANRLFLKINELI